ncbi:VAN3-binding protein [Tanacetum coccineum]
MGWEAWGGLIFNVRGRGRGKSMAWLGGVRDLVEKWSIVGVERADNLSKECYFCIFYASCYYYRSLGHREDEEMMKFDLAVTYATTLMVAQCAEVAETKGAKRGYHDFNSSALYL